MTAKCELIFRCVRKIQREEEEEEEERISELDEKVCKDKCREKRVREREKGSFTKINTDSKINRS